MSSPADGAAPEPVGSGGSGGGHGGPGAPGRGVIHDIGYRHYDGPRLGERYVQRSLFAESLKGAYGLGRSMRSKVMPMLILALICLPALVMVIITSVTGGSELPVTYASYPFRMQIIVAIYLAAQAPALVSRDLRFRVVPLYFARPLGRAKYVQAKLAAMTVALFVLMAVPLTILFVGALLVKISVTDALPDYLKGLAVAVAYAVVLAMVGVLIAALTPRRGLGVAAVITVLLVLSGVQATVLGIANEFGEVTLAGYSGLMSPATLVDGLASRILDIDSTLGAEPPGTLGLAVFALVTVVLVVGCYAALLARYRRVPVS